MAKTKDTGESGKTRWGAVLVTATLAGGMSAASMYYAMTGNLSQDLKKVQAQLGFSKPLPTVLPAIPDREIPAVSVISPAQTADSNVPAAEVLVMDPAVMDVATQTALRAATQVVPAIVPDPVAEALSMSPELRSVIEEARILKDGQKSQDWAQQNMGYVPKGSPGEVLPGMERVQSIPDAWVIGDSESEGGGEAVPNYFSVSGTATFTDEGELSVNGTRILLSGALLPQPGGHCTTASDESYDCQSWAVSGLKTHIEGKTAFCSVSETNGNNYGLCDVLIGEDGKAIDLASWMVSAGIAVAYDVPAPSLYHPQELEAKTKKLGLWSGTFAFGGRSEALAGAEQ